MGMEDAPDTITELLRAPPETPAYKTAREKLTAMHQGLVQRANLYIVALVRCCTNRRKEAETAAHNT